MRVLVAVDGSPASVVARCLVASLPWAPDDVLRIVTVLDEGHALFGPRWAAVAVSDPGQLEGRLEEASQAVIDQAVAGIEPGVSARVEAAVLRGPAAVDHRPGGRRVPGRPDRHRDARQRPVPERTPGLRIGRGRGSRTLPGADRPTRDSGPDRAGRRWVASGRNGCAGSSARAPSRGRRSGSSAWRPCHRPGRAPSHRWRRSWPCRRGTRRCGSTARITNASPQSAAKELASRRDPGRDRSAGRRPGRRARRRRDEWNADLIAIGTHGRTGLRRLLIGSVARNVLHHASASVLVAREGRGENVRGA